ncbi:MAG: glycosyltransferase family 4 protein, partial [Actinomycetota bacterium]
MRLLEVTNDFPPTLGGIENYAFSLVSRWQPDEVVVLARKVPGSDDFDRRLPFEMLRQPVRLLLPTPTLLRKTVEIIRTRSIDIVHFASPVPLALLGPRIRRATGVPYAVSVHGGELVLAASLPAARSLLATALRQAQLVLPASLFTQRAVLDALGGSARNPPPISVLTPGVDPDRFSPDVSPPEHLRLGGPVIVAVSRMVARKGAGTLIAALPRILSRHPGARLLLVGGGPDLPRLGRLARALGVAPAVIFAGPQPWSDIARFYAAGNIFALPTRARFRGLETEGFPLVYLEAASCGLPAVAGDAGGVCEAVIEDETGYIVDGRRPERAAAAIERLLDDP